ncbi:uncharacterized protein [Chironomus tepperi]|uniref:uncharacterized protein n=1 Tax=Chironomus tepperi TaxID=113505 RepID=UPI00391F574A
MEAQILSTIKASKICANILGFLPLSLNRNDKNYKNLLILSYIYSAILITIMTLTLGHVIFYLMQEYENVSLMPKKIHEVIEIVFASVSISQTGGIFVHARAMSEIFEKFCEIDEKIHSTSSTIRINYSKHRTVIQSLCLFGIVNFSLPTILGAIIQNKFSLSIETAMEITIMSRVVQIIDFSLMFSQSMFFIIFLIIIAGIYIRYKVINKILETEHHTTNMTQLAAIHLKLFDTVTLVMHVFSFPIMLSFGYKISGGVFSIYEMLSIATRPNVTSQQIGFCMWISAWLPDAILASIIEVACCMAAANEGRRTIGILRRILCQEDDEKVRKRLKLFLLQICHSKPVFGCGLFEFNWQLLGIAFGAVVQSLVIMIQFDLAK